MSIDFNNLHKEGRAKAQDRSSSEKKLDSNRVPRGLRLEQIKDRAQNTRETDEAHVLELAESITSVGLLHPIVVDQQQQLLAGGHRLAAIQHIKDNEPSIFKEHFSDGVPVHVIDFDSTEDADGARALAIEIAENEKRRDYTDNELSRLIERMESAGYKVGKGTVKSDALLLSQGLQVALGKSRTSVWRILKRLEALKSPPLEPSRKEQTVKSLKAIQRSHSKFLEDHGRTTIGKELAVSIQKLSEQISAAIEQ